MIEFNVIVPSSDKESIRVLIGDRFKIISGSYLDKNKTYYFHIEGGEEDMLVFMLKYGSENVWKR